MIGGWTASARRQARAEARRVAVAALAPFGVPASLIVSVRGWGDGRLRAFTCRGTFEVLNGQAIRHGGGYRAPRCTCAACVRVTP